MSKHDKYMGYPTKKDKQHTLANTDPQLIRKPRKKKIGSGDCPGCGVKLTKENAKQKPHPYMDYMEFTNDVCDNCFALIPPTWEWFARKKRADELISKYPDSNTRWSHKEFADFFHAHTDLLFDWNYRNACRRYFFEDRHKKGEKS